MPTDGGADALPAPSLRCAVHPARPALDRCPVCRQPRCGVDADLSPGGGCLRCSGVAAGLPVGHPRSTAGRLVTAVLAVVPATVAAAWVSSQYVGAAVFSLVLPGLTGCLCGWVVLRAAGGADRTALGYAVRTLAVVAAAAGTACSFLFVPGGESALHPAGRVVPPYAVAVAAAWLWTRPAARARDGRGQEGRGQDGRGQDGRGQDGRGTRTT
ncbi:MAG: hypothetical protein M3Z02_06755 [Actinomycetota bacterium]|nr:hypothetical protein [Actinomycetota bacterium]